MARERAPEKPVLIVLGGAQSVYREWEEARRFLQTHKKEKVDFFAVNDVGCLWPQPLKAWASLHPEKLWDWRSKRVPPLNQNYLVFSQRDENGANPTNIVQEKWGGSSGLYAVQCGLLELGYEFIITCGIPLDARPHYFDDKAWKDCYAYREGWMRAYTEIKDRVRSMSGWTRAQFGNPNDQWIKGNLK